MKATIVRIGNSRGIRLPTLVIEQCGFEDGVELKVHHHELVIRASSQPRDGWAEAFARMRECGDDELLDRVAETGSNADSRRSAPKIEETSHGSHCRVHDSLRAATSG